MQDSLPQVRQSDLRAQRRVLLVDDDLISLEILSLLLGFDGHEVLRAADGESALGLLTSPDSSASPDVLLVDMQMPGICGQDLVQKIRALEGPRPLLLGMSATALDKTKLTGFDGFLLKPLELNDLRKALRPKGNKKTLRTKAKAHPRLPRTDGPSEESKVNFHRPGSRPWNGENDSNGTAAGEIEGINHSVLNKLRSAMRAESLRELYAACLTDVRQRVNALASLAHTGDLDGIRRVAHQIKGAASMVGAVRIARLASTLELGSCKIDETLILLDHLRDSCDQLERMLLAGKI